MNWRAILQVGVLDPSYIRDLQTTTYGFSVSEPTIFVIDCFPFGDDSIRISLKKSPNWFHRMMMTILFGFKWKKIKEE